MAEQTTNKSTRLLRNMLVVSLAANLIIVGLVVGTVVSGRLGDGGPRSVNIGNGSITRALSPEERRAVGDQLRHGQGLSRAARRAMGERVVNALRQEPFDSDVLRDVLAGQGVRMKALREQAQDAIIVQIENMSTERRAEFADQVEREMTRPRRDREERSGG